MTSKDGDEAKQRMLDNEEKEGTWILTSENQNHL